MERNKPRQYIREWRKFRALTQQALAERMGLARSYISHVEKGRRRYDQLFLEDAAEVLGCTPGDLIMRSPYDSEGLWLAWDQVDPVDRPVAAKMLRALKSKSA